MRTHYDHATFHQTGTFLNEKPRFIVKNVSRKLLKPYTLGNVLWHQGLGQYVFHAYEVITEHRVQHLTVEQLRDIANFITEQL